MDIISFEKRYVVPLGQPKQFNIVLVGVGGTGANLALILGRLAYAAGQQGITVRLTFIDPDIVEQGNIGRQPFCPAELGMNKATSMAQRLNLAYGLSITAVPDFFQPSMKALHPLRAHAHQQWRMATLVIGCVDNHLARRELNNFAQLCEGSAWFLDCGNAYSNGQVLIGNLPAGSKIEVNPLGMCSGLPLPYVQEPALLVPDPIKAPQQSCALLAARGEQSLIVNAQVAAVAGQRVHEFIFAREVRQMAATFNLSPMVMRATPITDATLAPYQPN